MRTLGTHHSSYSGSVAGVLRRLLAYGGVVAISATVLAGCAKPPPPPVTTPVTINLVGGADVNPDGRGRASPLTARVYALKTSGAFDSADFFSLFEKDQATLGAEMVQREEVLLRPGDTKKLQMTLAADVKAIGVIASYRDLERARWREVHVLDVGKPVTLNVNFVARRIAIDAKVEKPPAK